MKALFSSFAVALLLVLLPVTAEAESSLLIKDTVIVDIEKGSLLPRQSVLIGDGLIVEVGPNIAIDNAETQVIDARGAYLIPGLWDSHVHIFSTPTEPDNALPLYLVNGVTGIRDMGALWPITEQKNLQRKIERGEVLGPRLILSGAWVDAAPGSWPGMFLADTPNEARAVAKRIAAEGWAAIKTYSMLDEKTYLSLAEAAHANDLPLVGHIPERVALSTAIKASHDGMEHFSRIPMACSTAEADMLDALRRAMEAGADRKRVFEVMAARNRIVLETWDEALCRRVLAQLAAAHMHVSPTLVVADFYVGERPGENTPRMRMLPSEVRAAWARPDFRLDAMTDEVRALADASIALDHRTFLMAHRAGVPILASTDASFANPWLFHGFSLLDELDLYVRIGLTPREALYTATVAPPRFFELQDQDGMIVAGRRADLVLISGNPLAGLSTLRRPRAVIVRGQLLDRKTLDRMESKLMSASGTGP